MSETLSSSKTTPWPTSTAELDPSERLIVWTFRRWVTGLRRNDGSHWSLVWSEFAHRFGAIDGKEALAHFAGLVMGLQSYARRTIHHHQPCCPCLGADEVSLICLIAACQNRQPSLARGLAEWMVQPDGIGELLQSSVRLAQIMGQHGLTFPERTIRAAKTAEASVQEPVAAVIH